MAVECWREHQRNGIFSLVSRRPQLNWGVTHHPSSHLMKAFAFAWLECVLAGPSAMPCGPLNAE